MKTYTTEQVVKYLSNIGKTNGMNYTFRDFVSFAGMFGFEVNEDHEWIHPTLPFPN